MRIHTIKALAVGIMTILAILFPFMPGEYDSLAVMISLEAQMFAYVSILFIPLGIAWLLYNLAVRKNGGESKNRPEVSAPKAFAVCAAVIVTLCFVVSIFAAIGGAGSFRGSAALGILLLVCYAFLLFTKIIPKLTALKQDGGRKRSISPVCVILIPAAVLSFRFAFAAPLAEYSKNTAIEQAGVMIGDIEAYYLQYGFYPNSIQGLWKDYSTGVIGIEKYYYETNGEAYNLFFENFPSDITAREIVMYNKLDEHVIRSHPSFMFSLPPDEFERYRGYFSERSLPQEHWKSYLFD
ncbi:MAG: hypothetical protein LBS62_09970 [Clostridiales bacterium]|jgi:hypothetical protein|nr:hypothetical protein [Clostridiales bacterium]